MFLIFREIFICLYRTHVKHSNAYLVRQKQCQQKQRSQYVPSLTQFLG